MGIAMLISIIIMLLALLVDAIEKTPFLCIFYDCSSEEMLCQLFFVIK